MHDVLIVGGGVIGLSLAWDLARHGTSVHVIDRGPVGREASWAGAGILPAANLDANQHPYDQLRGLAAQLHSEWAVELRELTGIDNGYRRCGAIHLARTPGESAALVAWANSLRDEGIEVQNLSLAELEDVEPGLAPDSPSTAIHIAAEAQLRNPWHLRALTAACERWGVMISPELSLVDTVIEGDEIVRVETTAGSLRAGRYCFAAGAWTGQLLARLGVRAGILPVRGQMVLFRCPHAPIKRIINEGSRYLVPREDGRVLAGSTEEEVGFDKRTTAEAISELTALARDLVPALREAPIEQTWAGLRPGSFDGLPYLNRLPGLKNAFIAAGHFRSGLFLSTATAVVMSQLLRDQPPQIDLSPFRVTR